MSSLRCLLLWTLFALSFTAGCGGPPPLPDDEQSLEERRLKEVEMMQREMRNE